MEKQIDLPDTMQAAVMTSPMHIEIQTVSLPETGPYDVLIKVMAVGICGSDIHYYEHGKIGKYVVDGPFILGHECAGVVVGLGSEVLDFQLGDRVAIEPGVVCGQCDLCRQGRYNLCEQVKFLATPPVDGAFMQYLSIHKSNVFVIPDHVTFEEAALCEPLSVGIHAANKTQVRPGQTVAIHGMGPVGLMAVLAAKSFGAGKIIVTDLEQARLQAAIKLGATHAIDIRSDHVSDEIMKITAGAGADIAFETAGHPSALQAALETLTRGGKLAIVGLPQQSNIPINIPEIADKEIEIYGVFRYANTYPAGISILSEKRTDLSFLVTDRFDLQQTQLAMETARVNKQSSLKVIVYPNGQ